jgi:hypothetical protein
MSLVVGTNSYIDVTNADLYFAERLHSVNWTGAETADKEKALIQATGMIDDLFDWPGTVTDEDQSLGWPRTGVYDCEGREVDPDTIPDAIEKATCEQAIYLLGAIDPNQTPDLIKQGFKKGKLGPMDVETDKSMVPDKIGSSVAYSVGCLGDMKPGATSSGSFSGETIRQ